MVYLVLTKNHLYEVYVDAFTAKIVNLFVQNPCNAAQVKRFRSHYLDMPLEQAKAEWRGQGYKYEEEVDVEVSLTNPH